MTETKTVAKPKSRRHLPEFLGRHKLAAFLTVIMSGQVVYSAFEAFKGSLMLPLTQMLGLTNAEFGIIMGWIGISTFLYIPCGWVNNRFRVRSILFWSLGWRLVTTLFMFNLPDSWAVSKMTLPSWLQWISHDGISSRFLIMVLIAMTWGVLDAIMWPAVVNGTALVAEDADHEGKGLAMGLLESIRRAAEFIMNLIVIGFVAAYASNTVTVMYVAATVYALLIIPMMYFVWNYVPDTPIAKSEQHSDSVAALIALLKMLTQPRVWLAGLAALCIYWTYVNLMYTSAPYLTQVYGMTTGQAALFGVFNTGAVGIFAGVVSGFVSDYVFKSSTKMMAISLAASAVIAAVVLVLPKSPDMLIPTLGLLILAAFATFLSKSVILAPIAELKLPEGASGSAMSIGSFMAYASILWAYTWNGALLDRFKDTPEVAYRQIFGMTVACALFGAVCATILLFWNRKRDKYADAAISAGHVLDAPGTESEAL